MSTNPIAKAVDDLGRSLTYAVIDRRLETEAERLGISVDELTAARAGRPSQAEEARLDALGRVTREIRDAGVPVRRIQERIGGSYLRTKRLVARRT